MADVKNIKYGNFVQIYINGIYLGDNAFIALQEVYKFMNNMFPFKVLYFKTSSDVINKLDFFNKPVCEVQVHHYRVENTTDTEDSGYTQSEKPSQTLYRTDTYFGTVDQQVYPLTDKEQDKINESQESINREVARRVFLYKEDFNLFTNNYINTVAKNVNISDLLAYGFDICVKEGHMMYLSPIDNTITYDQLTIEPKGFLQLLKTLDDEYGIYLTKLNVFVIDKTVYVINTNKDFKVADNIKPIDIKIAKSTNLMSSTIRGIDEETNSMVLNIDNLIIDDVLSEHHIGFESNITSSNKLVSPKGLAINNNQIIIGDKILYKEKLQKDTSNPLRRYAFKAVDILFDINPLQTWNIIDENFQRNNLRMWSISRVITPDNISVNIELFDRVDKK